MYENRRMTVEQVSAQLTSEAAAKISFFIYFLVRVETIRKKKKKTAGEKGGENTV